MGYIVIFLIGVIFVLFITIMIVMNFYRKNASPHSAAAAQDTTTSLARVDDLAAFVRQHPHCVVMIHAEWCTHCKKMAPLLRKVAVQQKSEMVFGSLDGPNHAQVLDAYSIQGFPTLLRFYQGNKIAEIRGMQTEDALHKFVKL